MYYICVDQHKNTLYIKSRNQQNKQSYYHKTNGKEIDLSLYIEDNNSVNTTKTTLYNNKLREVKFNTISELADFKYKFKNDFEFWNDFYLPNQYITQTKLYENPSFSDINICFIDIETESEFSFAKPENPTERINAITFYSNQTKVLTTFCLSPVAFELDNCYCYADEKELLEEFLKFWKQSDIDIISSWNGNYYDMPYLYNRMSVVLSDKKANTLSPFNIVTTSSKEVFNRPQITIQIVGLVQLDYLQLYKKFILDPRDNDKLDTIAEKELGINKVSYTQYNSLKEFYKNDFITFIKYNRQDVNILIELENKLKLIILTFIICYRARQNFVDVFMPTKTWDSFCYNYLWDNNKVIQPFSHDNEDSSFEGAFVIEPIPGKYEWVATFDVTSLYPSIIRFLNISPETLDETIESELRDRKWVNELINRKITNPFTTHTLSANGQFYKKDTKGMFPTLIETMFNDRMTAVGLLAQKEKQLNDQSLVEDDKKVLVQEIAALNNEQHALKIALNSLYGATGTPNFRYFNIKNAEAVTTTGQVITRSVQESLDKYLRSLFNEQSINSPFVIGGDTDSVFLCLQKVLEHVDVGLSVEEKVKFIDYFCINKITPLIKNIISNIETRLNGNKNLLTMGREFIGNSMIITGKKHYALSYHDKKGVFFKSPKYKVVGIESIKSSTPKLCRTLIKNVLENIFINDNDYILQLIKESKQQILNAPIDMIAFPRSVNGITKYSDNKTIYKSKTPIQTRAAILFNKFIQDKNLTHIYSPIMDGEKIKFIYLKLPNPFNEDVIGWSTNTVPSELNLTRYVDVEKVYEVGYLSVIDNILDSINWNKTKINDVNDWF